MFPANIFFFRVNNRNTRRRCETFWKLTIKTPQWHHWHHSAVFIVNFEYISRFFLLFLLLALNKKLKSWVNTFLEKNIDTVNNRPELNTNNIFGNLVRYQRLRVKSLIFLGKQNFWWIIFHRSVLRMYKLVFFIN